MRQYLQLIISICILLLVRGELIDLNESNYEEFLENNKIHLINLCSSKILKCRGLRTALREVSDKSYKQLGEQVNIGYIDVDKYPSLADKYIWEGFASIFYINSEENEKESYLGAKDFKRIMKYLRYKMVLEVEEINSEKELQESMRRENLKVAVVLIGDRDRIPFTVDFLARAAKQANFPKLFTINNQELNKKLKVIEYDLAIYSTKTNSFEILNLSEEEDLNLNKLTKILLINKRNQQGYFQSLKAVDMEYSLHKNVPTLFYIYGERKHLSPQVESDIVDLAKRYKNEFLFFKSSINNKPLKLLNFQQFFNLTKDDLPALVITSENPYSTDDVEKYVIKSSQLSAHSDQIFKQQMEAKRTPQNETNENLEPQEFIISKKNVENFLENFKKGKLYKTFFTKADEIDINMTGENFVQVIDEALDENKEVALIICPTMSLKYERMRTIIDRVFDKIYTINEERILFDEFETFYNEISLIDYKYIPTIAFIRKNPDTFSPNKWIVNLMEKNFTNEAIIKFIQSNSKGEVEVNNTMSNPIENEDEIVNPLYPILKSKLEGRFLTENFVKKDIGFKRRWYSLKKHGQILSEDETSEFDTPNEWDEDPEPDDYSEVDRLKTKSHTDFKTDL